MKGEVIPFGKYEGQPLEILNADPNYRNWLVNQGWFIEQHPKIHTLIVNNFQEPTDTPEHNSMQARFLDTKWVAPLFWDTGTSVRSMSIRFEVNGWDVLFEGRVAPTKEVEEWPELKISLEAQIKELRDKDWNYNYNKIHQLESQVNRGPFEFFRHGIELKPTIGDDYPSILRNMKKLPENAKKHLFYYNFSSRGVTEEVFIKIMGNEGITAKKIQP